MDILKSNIDELKKLKPMKVFILIYKNIKIIVFITSIFSCNNRWFSFSIMENACTWF
jgi:hypothetical protein